MTSKNITLTDAQEEVENQQHLAEDQVTNDRGRRFKPFKAIRRMFRDGRKKLIPSKENLNDDEENNRYTTKDENSGLNRRISLSHDSVFSPEVVITKSEIPRSSPIPISGRMAISDESLKAPGTSYPTKVAQLQDQLRLNVRSIHVDNPSSHILSTSAPPFLSIIQQRHTPEPEAQNEQTIEPKKNRNVEKMEKEVDAVNSTGKSVMDVTVEPDGNRLNNAAAYDRIAARPKNRRARKRPPPRNENSAFEEFDITSSVFPSISTDEKPSPPKELCLPTENLVGKERRKSEEIATSDSESRDKEKVGVKKAHSFKSPLGGGVVPCLNDVKKVKLRKTLSPSSPDSSTKDSLFSSKGSTEDLKDQTKVRQKPLASPKKSNKLPKLSDSKSKNAVTKSESQKERKSPVSPRNTKDRSKSFHFLKSSNEASSNDDTKQQFSPKLKKSDSKSPKPNKKISNEKIDSENQTSVEKDLSDTSSKSKDGSNKGKPGVKGELPFTISLKKTFSNEGLKKIKSSKDSTNSSEDLHGVVEQRRKVSDSDTKTIDDAKSTSPTNDKTKESPKSPSLREAAAKSNSFNKSKLKKTNQIDIKDDENAKLEKSENKNISAKKPPGKSNWPPKKEGEPAENSLTENQKVSPNESTDDIQATANKFGKLRKVSRSESDKRNQEKDPNKKPGGEGIVDSNENIFGKLQKVRRSDSDKRKDAGSGDEVKNDAKNLIDKPNENVFGKLRKVGRSNSDKRNGVKGADGTSGEDKSNKDSKEDSKSNENVFGKLRKVKRTEAGAITNTENEAVKPGDVKDKTTEDQNVVKEDAKKGVHQLKLKTKTSPTDTDKQSKENEQSDQKPSLFPVKLRNTGQGGKLFNKDNKEDLSKNLENKALETEKPKNGTSRPHSVTGVVFNKSQNKNNSNSFRSDKRSRNTWYQQSSKIEDILNTPAEVTKSPPKVAKKPKPVQVKPAKRIEIKYNKVDAIFDDSSSMPSAVAPVQNPTPSDEVSHPSSVENDSVSNKKEPKELQDSSTPSWVSLARRRSKKWENSISVSKPVDINHKSMNKTSDRSKQSQIDENKPDLSKPELEIKQGPVEINEDEKGVSKLQSITYKNMSKSLESKPAVARKSTQRSISADVSNPQTHILSGKRGGSMKTRHQQIESPTTNTPPWLTIAMQKQQRWVHEETV